MIKRRLLIQKIFFSLFRLAGLLNGLALAIIVYFMLSRGWSAISWEFLTQAPRESMTQGGILPCIVGTLSLCLVTILVALPIGVASAVYLNEYATQGRLVRIIRLGINNLAGVPSIVFGLFWFGLFLHCIKNGCICCGWRVNSWYYDFARNYRSL